MDKRSLLVLTGIFALMLLCNHLMPVAFGDDYVYAFVWTGQPMMVPLPEDARRVASFADIFASQVSHYLTWGGRAPAHVLVQFFMWQGKALFDVLNSLVFVLLVMEIHWLADGGRVSLRFRAGTLCWIFFCLWVLVATFGGVFIWLSGSCNYLWTLVLQLAFLLPYERRFLGDEDGGDGSLRAASMLLLGLLAGWTNEHTVLWILVSLAYWIFRIRKREESVPRWMLAGVLGMAAGYALLMLAPGNFARFVAESTMTADSGFWDRVTKNLFIAFVTMLFQLLVWFFVFDTMKRKELFGDGEAVRRRLFLVRYFCGLSVISVVFLCFTRFFVRRATLPSFVFLFVAAAILIRLQHDTGKNLMDETVRRMLHIAGGAAFALMTAAALYGGAMCKSYDDEMLALVSEARGTGEVVEIRRLAYPRLVHTFGAMHIIDHGPQPEERNWGNVAFARYHGIKGIRAIGEGGG